MKSILLLFLKGIHISTVIFAWICTFFSANALVLHVLCWSWHTYTITVSCIRLCILVQRRLKHWHACKDANGKIVVWFLAWSMSRQCNILDFNHTGQFYLPNICNRAKDNFLYMIIYINVLYINICKYFSMNRKLWLENQVMVGRCWSLFGLQIVKTLFPQSQKSSLVLLVAGTKYY